MSVVQPTTCSPLSDPPDNGEDCISVLIQDAFVDTPIGCFWEKKIVLALRDFRECHDERETEGGKFFLEKKIQNHRTCGSAVNSPHTARAAHVRYPCGILDCNGH